MLNQLEIFMKADEFQERPINQTESLRKELVQLVQDKLTPASTKYDYSDRPLENSIKWRPLILVLGNYSAGKSTLINEFLGCDVQRTA